MTRDQVEALEAGAALNHLVSIAIQVHRCVSSDTDWFTYPSLWSERLRRQLDLPQTNPLPSGYPVYAGEYDPDWSGEDSTMTELISFLGLNYIGPDTAVGRAKFVVLGAMDLVGLE